MELNVPSSKIILKVTGVTPLADFPTISSHRNFIHFIVGNAWSINRNGVAVPKTLEKI